MNDSKPSVVLLDLNLPDSRGAETFRKVLNKVPDVPVVVLSGQDDEELALKAVHQGVQDYLVKGAFDSKQLSRATVCHRAAGPAHFPRHKPQAAIAI